MIFVTLSFPGWYLPAHLPHLQTTPPLPSVHCSRTGAGRDAVLRMPAPGGRYYPLFCGRGADLTLVAAVNLNLGPLLALLAAV